MNLGKSLKGLFVAPEGEFQETNETQPRSPVSAVHVSPDITSRPPETRKIQAFSHQEYNLSEYTDPGNLQKRIDNAIDLFSRKEISLKYVPLDSSFPFHLLENRDKYKHLIKEI